MPPNTLSQSVDGCSPESKLDDVPLQDSVVTRDFARLWTQVTEDNYFSLFGFRRFRTAHLLNLRFLENEIDTLDHQIYQAGIRLERSPTSGNKLGLAHAKKDHEEVAWSQVIDETMIMKLRDLLRKYGLSQVSR